MISQYLLTQGFAVEMRIDLSGADALVSQHLLDGPQVSPSLQQMGSERVPEGVRTDDLLDAGQFRLHLDDVEDRDA